MFSYGGLTMRPVETSDLMWLKDLRNDQTTWENLLTIAPLTEEGQALWLKGLASNTKVKPYVVLNEFGTRIGFIRTDEIDQLNRSIRIGADVERSFRGKGYGVKIYEMLLKYCFDYLNMHRVWLCVLDTNSVAIKLYNKVGFKSEGSMRHSIFRDGKYIDQTVMSILENEYRDIQK
jgi:RimJ/RimL family protein N-acetyltransferase